MNNNRKVLWITNTAVFLALLIGAQLVTSQFGNTFVTGSVNNLLMIVAVMMLGLTSGLTLAVISPVVATLMGIGPLWGLVPFIILGNMTLVACWHFIGGKMGKQKYVFNIVALVCAAVAKFLVLYIGIVKIAVPVLLNLPEKAAANVTAMFSVSQLFTASVGGVLALLILPVLKKAVKGRRE